MHSFRPFSGMFGATISLYLECLGCQYRKNDLSLTYFTVASRLPTPLRPTRRRCSPCPLRTRSTREICEKKRQIGEGSKENHIRKSVATTCVGPWLIPGMFTRPTCNAYEVSHAQHAPCMRGINTGRGRTARDTQQTEETFPKEEDPAEKSVATIACFIKKR